MGKSTPPKTALFAWPIAGSRVSWLGASTPRKLPRRLGTLAKTTLFASRMG
jgi:hypothetical protein